jgi:serine protease Do
MARLSFLFKLPDWPLTSTEKKIWLGLHIIFAYLISFIVPHYWPDVETHVLISLLISSLPMAYLALIKGTKITRLLLILLSLLFWVFLFFVIGDDFGSSSETGEYERLLLFISAVLTFPLLLVLPMRLGLLRLPFLTPVIISPVRWLARHIQTWSFLVVLLLVLGLTTLADHTRTLEQRIAKIESVIGEALTCNETEVVESVAKSIVRVVGGESEGSGVIIDSDGLIVTNFHVIQFEPAPKVVFSDYSFEQAEIVMASKEIDLAVLKIKPTKLMALKPDTIAASELQPLQQVLAFGFPWGTDIAGGVTIQRGGFVSLRNLEGVEMIHTDISLNPGNSGGALTDRCGRLIGINTAGVAGMGFAISAEQLNLTIATLATAEDPLKDVEKIEFKPFESPVESVKAFYNFQKVRQLEKAYKLLSPFEFNKVPFAEWEAGYANVIDVELVMVKADPDKDNRVQIKLVSKDLVGQEVIYKYFEGWWDTVLDTESYYLGKHQIIEIDPPGWSWWYE